MGMPPPEEDKTGDRQLVQAPSEPISHSSDGLLGSEEGIEYWMRFSAGKMTSGEGAGHCGQRRGTER